MHANLGQSWLSDGLACALLDFTVLACDDLLPDAAQMDHHVLRPPQSTDQFELGDELTVDLILLQTKHLQQLNHELGDQVDDFLFVGIALRGHLSIFLDLLP